jgi:hypothetical protein
MNNKELFNKLIDLELAKLEIQIKAHSDNLIKQELENIKQLIFSLGLIEESNEVQIKNNIKLLYKQYSNYYEFIYQQIKELGGYFHEVSNRFLIKDLEDKINECKGDDLNKKIINYFILNNLNNSNSFIIKKDFFYIIYILQYKGKEIIMNEITNLKNKYIKKNKPSKAIIEDIDKIKHRIKDLNIQNEIFEERKKKYEKIDNILGEQFLISRLNFLLTIVFLILKFKFNKDIGIKTFAAFITIGFFVGGLLKTIFDPKNCASKIDKNDNEISQLYKKLNSYEYEIKLFNQYVSSLQDFII